MLNKYEEFEEEKKKELIEMIYQSSDHGYKLLENLLNWSRMQMGKIEWKPGNIDLYTHAFENVSLLKAAAQNKKIHLISEIEKDTMVYADPNMVTMVIRNLVSNAVKFTREGGEVRLMSETDGNYEQVTVSDTGLGITEESIGRIFRTDVHHSTLGTANEQGTGLGLILCKEFMERNAGKIWIESEFGKGSDFKLPCLKPG